MLGSISSMDLTNCIKEVLINHGFTLDALIKTPPAELAIMLGIDLYFARIIYLAAERHAEVEHANDKMEYVLKDIGFSPDLKKEVLRSQHRLLSRKEKRSFKI